MGALTVSRLYPRFYYTYEELKLKNSKWLFLILIFAVLFQACSDSGENFLEVYRYTPSQGEEDVSVYINCEIVFSSELDVTEPLFYNFNLFKKDDVAGLYRVPVAHYYNDQSNMITLVPT